MLPSDQPIHLTPAEIEELNQKLSTFRHNVNNYLSLIVASVELIRRKPEMVGRLIDSLADQPGKITAEMKIFSDEFEKTLGIRRPPRPV